MATTARSWTRGCVPCGPGTCHRRPSPSTRRQPASFGDHLAATGVGDVAEIRRAHVESFLEHTLLTIPCQTASIYRWGASPPVLVGSDAIKREQIARLGGRLPMGSSRVYGECACGAFDVSPSGWACRPPDFGCRRSEEHRQEQPGQHSEYERSARTEIRPPVIDVPRDHVRAHEPAKRPGRRGRDRPPERAGDPVSCEYECLQNSNTGAGHRSHEGKVSSVDPVVDYCRTGGEAPRPPPPRRR